MWTCSWWRCKWGPTTLVALSVLSTDPSMSSYIAFPPKLGSGTRWLANEQTFWLELKVISKSNFRPEKVFSPYKKWFTQVISRHWKVISPEKISPLLIIPINNHHQSQTHLPESINTAFINIKLLNYIHYRIEKVFIEYLKIVYRHGYSQRLLSMEIMKTWMWWKLY